MDGMERASKKAPDTIFLHATGYKGNDSNFDNYVCHSFQARYLTGIAAGMLTKTNKIGVVGSHPIPEIIRNINALTLGAQSVNPNIEVSVVWINSWFDPPKDMNAAKVLADENHDILYTTTDSPSVVLLAQQIWKDTGKEVWSMGNDAPMGEYGPDRYITGMMFNWNVLYKHIVDQLAAGNLKMGERWAWGLQKNCVGLSPWGKNVPGYVINQVETVKMDWINDKMSTYFPFNLGITKADGSKVEAGEIARTELETMQYFVKGVVTPFP
jgi:basic membrane protein A